MNHVLHVAVIMHLRHGSEGRATATRPPPARPREALRCLKRQLSDVIYR